MDRGEDKATLSVGELTILAESVKANDKLLLSGGKWSDFTHWELSHFLVEIVSVSCRISLSVFILFRVDFFFFLNCIVGCLDGLEIFHSSIKSSISQTVVIDQRYSQVRPKSRHSLIVHPLLTDHLLDIYVLESGKNILFNFLNHFFTFSCFNLLSWLLLTLVLKYVVGDALVLDKTSAY